MKLSNILKNGFSEFCCVFSSVSKPILLGCEIEISWKGTEGGLECECLDVLCCDWYINSSWKEKRHKFNMWSKLQEGFFEIPGGASQSGLDLEGIICPALRYLRLQVSIAANDLESVGICEWFAPSRVLLHPVHHSTRGQQHPPLAPLGCCRVPLQARRTIWLQFSACTPPPAAVDAKCRFLTLHRELTFDYNISADPPQSSSLC